MRSAVLVRMTSDASPTPRLGPTREHNNMRHFVRATFFCAVLAAAANAQQPDSIRRKAMADSIAKARQDSIALQRELEKAMAQPTAPTAQAPTQVVGPTNPRLLPDVSAVGDFVGDLSPDGTTQEDRT